MHPLMKVQEHNYCLLFSQPTFMNLLRVNDVLDGCEVCHTPWVKPQQLGLWNFTQKVKVIFHLCVMHDIFLLNLLSSWSSAFCQQEQSKCQLLQGNGSFVDINDTKVADEEDTASYIVSLLIRKWSKNHEASLSYSSTQKQSALMS